MTTAILAEHHKLPYLSQKAQGAFLGLIQYPDRPLNSFESELNEALRFLLLLRKNSTSLEPEKKREPNPDVQSFLEGIRLSQSDKPTWVQKPHEDLQRAESIVRRLLGGLGVDRDDLVFCADLFYEIVAPRATYSNPFAAM